MALYFTQLTIARFLAISIIALVTVLTVKIVRATIDRSVKRASQIMKVDETRYSFLKHFISAIIYITGIGLIIYIIPTLRSVSVSLLAGAGVLAVVLGFASQAAFSNIISGVFIVIFKPFRVGDRIKVGTDAGIVEDITLRHTIIRTWKSKRLIIPNAIMSQEKIENSDLSDTKICKFIEIGISYDSDIDKAKKIMRKEAEKHPYLLDIRSEKEKKEKVPKVRVRVLSLEDSSVKLRAWAWAKDQGKGFVLACDLYESIKKRFDKEGIEIPFPHRTIVMKNAKRKKVRK